MESIKYFTQQSIKQNAPELRAGDTVRVHQKIREGNKERVQVFEGLVLAVRGGKSINSSYVVRRIASNGIGVERTFPLHSPNVVKVERLKSSKVRRARLYYMRERFGRLARMRNEAKNTGTWDEVVLSDEPVADAEPEVSADDVQTDDQAESAETELEATEQSPAESTEDEQVAPESTDSSELESPAEEENKE